MYILKFKNYTYPGLEFKFEKMEDASQFLETAIIHSVDDELTVEFRIESNN